jgi:hypothetical protein
MGPKPAELTPGNLTTANPFRPQLPLLTPKMFNSPHPDLNPGMRLPAPLPHPPTAGSSQRQTHKIRDCAGGARAPRRGTRQTSASSLRHCKNGRQWPTLRSGKIRLSRRHQRVQYVELRPHGAGICTQVRSRWNDCLFRGANSAPKQCGVDGFSSRRARPRSSAIRAIKRDQARSPGDAAGRGVDAARGGGRHRQDAPRGSVTGRRLAGQRHVRLRRSRIESHNCS